MGTYFAGGWLFHVASRKVLLNFRGSSTPFNPNTWSFFGGWSEDGDGGDPAVTWCREMREELGVLINPSQLVPLSDYLPPLPPSNPFHRYIFYCQWPTTAEAFTLAEDEADLAGYEWFTVEEALALPNLGQGARRDLTLFRDRLRQPT